MKFEMLECISRTWLVVRRRGRISQVHAEVRSGCNVTAASVALSWLRLGSLSVTPYCETPRVPSGS